MRSKYLTNIKVWTKYVIVDLRNPTRFRQGSIPTSLNYAFESNPKSKKSIDHGLAKAELVETLLTLSMQNKSKQLLLLCKDGGYVSKWVWDKLNLQTDTFIYKGGYRAYRKLVKRKLQGTINFLVLCGKTGSGKTELLHSFTEKGEQVLNLANLAKHKGSVFGNLGAVNQPTQEQFENSIFEQLVKMDSNLYILTEYEPINLGSVYLPDSIQQNLLRGTPIYISVSKQKRAKRLVKQYARINDCRLQQGIDFLKPKLGYELHQELTKQLEVKNYIFVASQLLEYFDQTPGYNSITPCPEALTITTDSFQEAQERIASMLRQKKTSSEEDATVKLDI